MAKKTSQENSKILRISIDTKAKVRVGEFSREGYERTKEVTKALDHDYEAKALLVPYNQNQLKLIFDHDGGELN